MQNTETQKVTGKVMMELSDKEAHLIEELRSFLFGKALVYLFIIRNKEDG